MGGDRERTEDDPKRNTAATGLVQHLRVNPIGDGFGQFVNSKPVLAGKRGKGSHQPVPPKQPSTTRKPD